MALVNEGGALRVVDGALGTGQACCCGERENEGGYCGPCIISTDESGEATYGYVHPSGECRPFGDDPYEDSQIYWCEYWACHAYTGDCIYLATGDASDWSILAVGYLNVCPVCPAEPTHTLCCGQWECGGNGPGPVPVHGLPFSHDPNQVMQPGETCAEYYTCDQTDIAGNGSCNYVGWFRSGAVGPNAVTDCDQCVPFCSAADCSYVLHGGAAAENDPSLVECSRCGWECDPVAGCIAVLDAGAANCPTCIAFCDPAADCAFVAYAATAADAGSVDYEPCDSCNPLP